MKKKSSSRLDTKLVALKISTVPTDKDLLIHCPKLMRSYKTSKKKLKKCALYTGIYGGFIRKVSHQLQEWEGQVQGGTGIKVGLSEALYAIFGV